MNTSYMNAAAQLQTAVENAKARMVQSLKVLADKQLATLLSTQAQRPVTKARLNHFDRKVTALRSETLGLTVADRQVKIAACLQAQAFNFC